MTKKRKHSSRNPQSAQSQGVIQEVPVLRLRADVPVRAFNLSGNLIIYEEHFPNIEEFAKYRPATDETFKSVLKGLAYTAVNALFLSQMGVDEEIILNALTQSQQVLQEFLALEGDQFSTARVLIADGNSIKEAIAMATKL